MLTHSHSWCAASTSSILAILSIDWCSWITSHGFCVISLCIQYLEYPGALADCNVPLFNPLLIFLRTYCSLAAVKDMHGVIPHLAPAMSLASPAATISISFLNEGIIITPPIGLRLFWEAIIAGFLSSRCVPCVCPPSIVQECWKCRSGVRWILEINCQSQYVAFTWGCCILLKFLFFDLHQDFSQLWQTATDYGCIIAAQKCLKRYKQASKAHVPQA